MNVTSTLSVDDGVDDGDDDVTEQECSFSSSDIRYRSTPKEIIKETALSLFIISPRPHTRSVSKFINDVKNFRRTTSYEGVGECDKIVRMDLIFKDVVYQKIFRNKVEDLERPQELTLIIKSVSEDLLLHREEPVLMEKELLSIFGNNLSENIFRGFTVSVIELSSNLLFKFESMMKLNTFLAREVGVEEAFLGMVRKRDLNYQLDFLKKYRNKLYPLRVKLETCCFDWEEGKKKYKFQESKNKLSRTQQFTTIDFTEKKDLFHFVANEPVGFIFKFKKRK